MKAFIALSLFALALPAQAVICKTVDPEGGVSYSDIPAEDCPNRVNLPEPSRYSPPPSSAGGSPGPSAGGAVPEGDFTGYSAMKIEQPAQGSTVRNNEGQVPVSIALTPTLQPGHKLRLLLDGVQIQPSFASQSVTLTGVERGSHSLSAHVVSETGIILRSAIPVSFTLRKASLLEPGRAEGDGDAPPASTPQFKATPPAGNTYTPGTPNYSPPAAPAGATPGATNPAFAPKYSS